MYNTRAILKMRKTAMNITKTKTMNFSKTTVNITKTKMMSTMKITNFTMSTTRTNMDSTRNQREHEEDQQEHEKDRRDKDEHKEDHLLSQLGLQVLPELLQLTLQLLFALKVPLLNKGLTEKNRRIAIMAKAFSTKENMRNAIMKGS